MSDIETRIKSLEARVTSLEARGAGASTGSGGASGRLAPFDDEKLDATWADKTASKDPKKWTGESQIGKLYSQCPAEWHDSAAGLSRWKAERGRAEVPIRTNDKGKPWYEQDEFEAKLHAAWAIRIRRSGTAAPVAVTHVDDDIPF